MDVRQCDLPRNIVGRVLRALVRFKESEGHCRVLDKYTEEDANFSLGRWASKRRSKRIQLPRNLGSDLIIVENRTNAENKPDSLHVLPNTRLIEPFGDPQNGGLIVAFTHDPKPDG